MNTAQDALEEQRHILTANVQLPGNSLYFQNRQSLCGRERGCSVLKATIQHPTLSSRHLSIFVFQIELGLQVLDPEIFQHADAFPYLSIQKMRVYGLGSSRDPECVDLIFSIY